MSYSAKLKEDLILQAEEDGLEALLSGFLRCSYQEDRFSSDLATLIRYVYLKLQERGIESNIGIKKSSYSKLNRYYLDFLEKEDLKKLHVIDDQGLVEHIPGIYYSQMKLQRSYLKGAFLACGSISDPKRSYHLEMTFRDQPMAIAIKNLCEHFNLAAKIIYRNQWVVYIKSSQSIVDFLLLMGASSQAFALEDIKILRSMKNDVNRLVNCETANINKTVEASLRHLRAIELIQNTIGLAALSKPLQEIALCRWEEPELSLKELGERLDPPLSKSGVNNRLSRLLKIAQKLEES
ncbi:MAG TPA: DNA-binding protein WhiA [Clostridia bacterium]|nr:DNA-binding protein WhiA [Clostridia bacterium]